MFKILKADSAHDLWLNAASLFSDRSTIFSQGSRKGPTLEALNAALTLTNPRERWIASREPAMNPAFALVEVVWILLGRNDSAFVNYFNPVLPKFQGATDQYHGAYGYRLRRAFETDQLPVAASALRQNPDSRQIVLQIWDCDLDLPRHDGAPRSEDIPCNIVSLLKVRNGALHWTQIMRSNDLVLGFPHNVVQFTSLQEVLAGWIGVNVGEYNHYSDSLHIYETDLVALDSTRSVNLPNNSDDVALPETESLNVLTSLNQLIQSMIDSATKASTIVSAIKSSALPSGYRNWLSIISADACRRRNEPQAAADAAHECTNASLTFMWNRWTARCQKAQAPQD